MATLTVATLSSLLQSTATAIVYTQNNINRSGLIHQVHNEYQKMTEAEHLTLEAEAENLKIRDFDEFGELFRAHGKLRARLIAANFP